MSDKKNMDWILSNQPLSREDWVSQVIWEGIYCGATLPFATKIDAGTVLILDGYIIPRLGSKSESVPVSKGKIPFSSVEELSRSLKGRFTIAWAEQEGIALCTDHHGMSKCFYSQIGGKWWISNNINSIIKVLDAGPDPIGIALFNLFEHFVGKRTLFANICCSEPASVIKMSEKQIDESTYWHPLQWIDKTRNYSDILDWRDFWIKLINGYTNGLSSKKVLLTLTGGNDSRLILAGLLALGIIPDSFTFGNPLSYDSIISAEISKIINSNHHCHFVEQPSSSWFRSCSEEIIRNGKGLINIHRSHRLDAIKRETSLNKNKDILFTGLMGGEYLKGISYDDYITAKFMRLWTKGSDNKINYFEDIIREKNMHLSDAIKECMLDEIFPSLSFFDASLSLSVRELIYLFQVVGSMHASQDPTIFSWKISNVISPFMDVDFLERLWGSPYSSLSREEENRTKGSAARAFFLCKLTHLLAPELSRIPYAKWGGYSAWELLYSPKTFRIKRVMRHFLKKDRYISNFPYGKWFYSFCKEELNNLHPEIKSFYNVKQLWNHLNEKTERNNEREWHFATNPINLSMNFRLFKGDGL